VVSDDQLRAILHDSPTIAILGIHDDPTKAAFYVPEYLHDEGYTILGVNPKLAGREMFGARVCANLREVGIAVDLVDVFRRADQIDGHVAEILALTPLPRVVWFQLGIRNDAAAAALAAAGITVIQDRCTLADHQRLRCGRPRAVHATIAT
jgi:hypothetical protein